MRRRLRRPRSARHDGRRGLAEGASGGGMRRLRPRQETCGGGARRPIECVINFPTRRRRLISYAMLLALAATTLHTARRAVGSGGGDLRRRNAALAVSEGKGRLPSQTSPPMQLNNYRT